MKHRWKPGSRHVSPTLLAKQYGGYKVKHREPGFWRRKNLDYDFNRIADAEAFAKAARVLGHTTRVTPGAVGSARVSVSKWPQR